MPCKQDSQVVAFSGLVAAMQHPDAVLPDDACCRLKLVSLSPISYSLNQSATLGGHVLGNMIVPSWVDFKRVTSWMVMLDICSVAGRLTILDTAPPVSGCWVAGLRVLDCLGFHEGPATFDD
jgi:hypothetical protein